MYSFETTKLVRHTKNPNVIVRVPEGEHANRRDSVVGRPDEQDSCPTATEIVHETNSEVKVEASLDLSRVLDQAELIDAVTKLLRLTTASTNSQREIIRSIKDALYLTLPGRYSTLDKSIVIQTLLTSVNNSSMRDDPDGLLVTARQIVAVLET